MKKSNGEREVAQRDTAASWYRRFHLSDYTVLLHLPFSSVVLDFAVIGTLLAQYVYVDRLLLAAAGVFLAHQGSHYFDEVKGRHWNTSISSKMLLTLSLLFLVAATAIGVYLAFTVSALIAIFIVPMVFFPMAYSLELWNGKFHGPVWFGLSCAFVVLGSFFLQTLTVSLFSVLMSLAAGVQGTYIIILYEATKTDSTRALAWNALKGIVLIWNLIAFTLIIYRVLSL